MLDSSSRYAVASRDFLTKAQTYLAEGDLVQASEKGWGAAAEIVKAVAEERGWNHRHHRLLYDIVDDLVVETGDESLDDLFGQACRLHSNFYENWMRPRSVRRALRGVEEFVGKLELMLV